MNWDVQTYSTYEVGEDAAVGEAAGGASWEGGAVGVVPRVRQLPPEVAEVPGVRVRVTKHPQLLLLGRCWRWRSKRPVAAAADAAADASIISTMIAGGPVTVLARCLCSRRHQQHRKHQQTFTGTGLGV